MGCATLNRIHLGHQLNLGSKLQATRCIGWHLGPGRLHSAPPATPRPEPRASGPCTAQTSQRLSASTQGVGSTRRSLSWAPRSFEDRALTPRGKPRSPPPHEPTESEGERQPTIKMSPGRGPAHGGSRGRYSRPAGGRPAAAGLLRHRRPRPVRASPATGGPRPTATPQALPRPGPPGSEQAAPPPQQHPPRRRSPQLNPYPNPTRNWAHTALTLTRVPPQPPHLPRGWGLRTCRARPARL